MARTQPLRRRHHFLARHLLAQFAGADGLVVVYDREGGWSFRSDIPERLALEKHLYAPQVSNDQGRDPHDDAVERWLADEVDGPAAPVVARLVGGAELEDLSEADRHALADFVAVLDMRTPRVRDLLVPAFREAGLAAIANPKQTQKALRRRGTYVTLGEIRRQARRHGSAIADEFAKPAWLDFIRTTRDRGRLNVKARVWKLLDAAGAQFATNDLGAVKAIIGLETPASWEPGTSLGRAHWLVPLSPARALAIIPPEAPLPVATPSFVAAINKQLFQDARRYVYTRDPVDVDRLSSGERAT